MNSSTIPFFQSVTIDGKNLQRIVFDKLAPAISDESVEDTIVSLLVFAILLMKPDIGQEELQQILLSTTEHIMMLLPDTAGQPN